MERRSHGWIAGLLGIAAALSITALIAASTANTAVANAAMQGDREGVRQLIAQAADVNAAQGDGMTPLHWAAMNGDAQMVNMLLYAGANPEASTRLGGLTPLDLAAKNGHAEAVSALLKGGADANAADVHGTTPLMLAAASGDVPSIAALVDAGAKLDARESTKDETALMFAAANGRTEAMKLLLSRGADWRPATRVFDWDKLPKTDPRLIAYSRLQSGARQAIDSKKSTAADKGAAGGKAAAGDKSANAEEPKPGKAGEPPREEDFLFGYVHLVGTQGGLTALMFAARQGSMDGVKALVDAGADVNQVDPGDKVSPLLIAIVNGRFDVAKYLLDHGADPNLAEDNGVTPLYAVVNCEWAEKAEFPHPLDYQNQQIGYLDLMKALLDRGADPNARLNKKVWYSQYNDDQSGIDEAGATPFWRAAYAADVDAMKLLVAYHADPNIPTMKPGKPAPSGAPYIADKKDESGLPPVPAGGPDIPPLLAAAGEGYGWSFTANHHRVAPTGMLAAVKYLVDVLHAEVNARDANGNTALHNAASRGDNAMIEYLVSKGATVAIVNRKGQTVADMANGPFQRTQPFPETIALLAKLGSKVVHKCVSC